MHILASNLAVWVSVIADETSHALHLKALNSHSSQEATKLSQWNYDSNYTQFVETVESQCNNSNSLLSYLDKSDDYLKGAVDIGRIGVYMWLFCLILHAHLQGAAKERGTPGKCPWPPFEKIYALVSLKYSYKTS